MKLIIQLNCTAGLGEMYSDILELTDYAHKFKKLGYNIQLNYCFNGSHGTKNKYLKEPVDFNQIYSDKNLNVFDIIETRQYPTANVEFDNFKCIRASGPGNQVGMHEWDAFVDVLPNEEMTYPKFKAQDLIRFKRVPIQSIEYVDKIVDRANEFSHSIGGNYDFLHIRNFDGSVPNDVMLQRIDLIYNKVQNSTRKYHLGSNNKQIIDKFIDLPNVYTFNFSHLDIKHNDHGYGHGGSSLTQDFLLDRLYENLTEMVSIKNADRIISTTSYNWTSSFITYGILKQLNENRFSWYNALSEDTTW